MRKAVQIQFDIRKIFPTLEIDLDKADQIERYITFLCQWNRKINLTAIREENQIFIKHILDSLSIIKIADNTRPALPKLGKTLDMGSGAGLPSIVLSIIDPDLNIVSVDKVKKKIAFQEFIKAQLQLRNFTPLAGSLKSLAQNEFHKNSYDTVICRAFDQLSGIFNFALDFLIEEGKLILWKGKTWKKEWENCPEQLKGSFSLNEEIPYELGKPELGGVLLLFSRISTDKAF
ncbi:MAG: 16S rRNA (guanine(527)-N(7))-methyltransferase RsmG [Proteobacteria bacterium]|nr:16S rRNA (guanine(527)-N(7))-methyltransferase RsmG [Pseudomonadota bacterium]